MLLPSSYRYLEADNAIKCATSTYNQQLDLVASDSLGHAKDTYKHVRYQNQMDEWERKGQAESLSFHGTAPPRINSR